MALAVLCRTLLLYLDTLEEYDGGATTFFDATSEETAVHAARVPKGSVLCFCHGMQPLSPLHEGSPVTRGVKHVVRTDVLYPSAPHEDRAAAEKDEAASAGITAFCSMVADL